MLFGNTIREFRDEQGLLQRQLATTLEIDTPMFSKIKRGDRQAKHKQVVVCIQFIGSQSDCMSYKKSSFLFRQRTSLLLHNRCLFLPDRQDAAVTK